MKNVAEQLWVVIPNFGDHLSLQEICSELNALFETQLKIIILDDSLGSDFFQDLPNNTIVVRPSTRLGQQRLLTHFFRSKFFVDLSPQPRDIVVVMDADGEDAPKDAPRLVEFLAESKCELVLAERSARIAPLKFKLGYAFFKAFSRLITGVTIKSGTFSASRWSWLSMAVRNGVFESSFSGGLASSHSRKQFVLISRARRRYGQSTQRLGGLVSHGLSIFWAFSGQISLRFFFFSILLTLSTILGSICVIALRILEIAVPGYTSIILLLLLQINILSLILFLTSFHFSKLVEASSSPPQFYLDVQHNIFRSQ